MQFILHSIWAGLLWLVVVGHTATALIESNVRISGPTDIFVYAESSLELNCSVLFSGNAADKVTWYKDNLPINETIVGERIKYIEEVKTSRGTTSHLRFQKVSQKDSGLYTCSPRFDFGPYATVSVHVKVWQATIEVPNGKKKFYHGNVQINLICKIPIITDRKSVSIKWIKNGKILSNNSPKRGITIRVTQNAREMTSKLFISNVSVNDSGTFTCAPTSKAKPDVIYVGVTVAKPYVEISYETSDSVPYNILMARTSSYVEEYERNDVISYHAYPARIVDEPRRIRNNDYGISRPRISSATSLKMNYCLLLILLTYSLI